MRIEALLLTPASQDDTQIEAAAHDVIERHGEPCELLIMAVPPGAGKIVAEALAKVAKEN